MNNDVVRVARYENDAQIKKSGKRSTFRHFLRKPKGTKASAKPAPDPDRPTEAQRAYQSPTITIEDSQEGARSVK